MLPREREGEDLQDQHNRRLGHVEGRGIPERDDARVHDVDDGVPSDAQSVKADLCDFKGQRAAVERRLRIPVDPNEYCDGATRRSIRSIASSSDRRCVCAYFDE